MNSVVMGLWKFELKKLFTINYFDCKAREAGFNTMLIKFAVYVPAHRDGRGLWYWAFHSGLHC